MEKQIQEIMNNFDFEKVHKVMTFLKWTWAGESALKIPDIQELKKESERLLKMVQDEYEKDNSDQSISTGGFTAKITYGVIELSFHITSWWAKI